MRTFAEREIKPHSSAWDKDATFPRHIIEKLGELGFLGVAFPEKYGGGGADTLSQVLVVEGISRYDAGVGLSCAAHMSLSSGHIGLFASERAQAQYLPEMLAAKKIGAWCLTEPESGSDAAAMRTSAIRSGDNYRIDGAKMFITNGSVADVYVVMAVTDGGAGRSGVSAFIVDRGTPGLSNGRKIEKLGLHSSDTAEVVFDNVTVPARNLIGDLGAGYQQTLKVLEGGRIGIAGFAIGIARGAMEDAAAYAKERRQFGKSIADFQAIQWMFADMATRIEASWLLMLRAAALKDRGQPFAREASMAKLLCLGNRDVDDDQGGADSRRLRLRQRISGRALHARRQARRNRRGHQRSAAHDHREVPATRRRHPGVTLAKLVFFLKPRRVVFLRTSRTR